MLSLGNDMCYTGHVGYHIPFLSWMKDWFGLVFDLVFAIEIWCLQSKWVESSLVEKLVPFSRVEEKSLQN